MLLGLAFLKRPRWTCLSFLVLGEVGKWNLKSGLRVKEPEV
jgi:hypothetical protein